MAACSTLLARPQGMVENLARKLHIYGCMWHAGTSKVVTGRSCLHCQKANQSNTCEAGKAERVWDPKQRLQAPSSDMHSGKQAGGLWE